MLPESNPQYELLIQLRAFMDPLWRYAYLDPFARNCSSGLEHPSIPWWVFPCAWLIHVSTCLNYDQMLRSHNCMSSIMFKSLLEASVLTLVLRVIGHCGGLVYTKQLRATWTCSVVSNQWNLWHCHVISQSDCRCKRNARQSLRATCLSCRQDVYVIVAGET
jgi:hypothetical protein